MLGFIAIFTSSTTSLDYLGDQRPYVLHMKRGRSWTHQVRSQGGAPRLVRLGDQTRPKGKSGKVYEPLDMIARSPQNDLRPQSTSSLSITHKVSDVGRTMSNKALPALFMVARMFIRIRNL